MPRLFFHYRHFAWWLGKLPPTATRDDVLKRLGDYEEADEHSRQAAIAAVSNLPEDADAVAAFQVVGELLATTSNHFNIGLWLDWCTEEW